jgi:predicted ATPase/DNA-binding winged helix-turn-helix (wHTH) protein
MNTAPVGIRERPASVLEFGTFRYEPKRWQVSDADGPCRIGSRAIQLLDVLLECPGRLYSREELVSRVWPDTVVEETSLRVQMSALRRLLGGDAEGAKFIANVPGRGYAFVAPVREVRLEVPALHKSTTYVPDVPARPSNLVGREAALEQLVELVGRERLVSVVGPVGVGKTVVAAAATARLQALAQVDDVVHADFSEISEPSRATEALCRACGLTVGCEDPFPVLEAAWAQQRVLLVLDNCDRLIEWVARCVLRFMVRCPCLQVVVTSSEPLEVEGEWVYRLAPLDVPEAAGALETEALLRYSAIRLFVERAQASSATFTLTRSNAAAVCQLCALLDGIPTALELAAAQMDLCTVQELVARRDRILDLLTRGRRTAAARHRSLNASVRWGLSQLGRSEAAALERLSIFAGSFGLDEAVALLVRNGATPQQAVQDVMNLCTRSMLLLEPGAEVRQRYRLLQVTRLFIEKSASAAVLHESVQFAIAPPPSTSTVLPVA